MKAAKQGELAAVRGFVEQYPSFWNWVDDMGGDTLTHKAAGYGQMEVFGYLLEKDPSGNALFKRNKAQQLPLDLVEQHGHLHLLTQSYGDTTIAQLLANRYRARGLEYPYPGQLQAARTTTSSSSATSTAVFAPAVQSQQATSSSAPSEQDTLTKSFGIIQNKDLPESEALKLIQQNVTSAPRILLMQDNVGKTLLSVAAENRRDSIINYLQTKIFHKSIGIIQNKDLPEIEALRFVQQNVRRAPRILQMQDDAGRTLLYVAAEYGRASIVEFLLIPNPEALFDVNTPDQNMNTPLAKAITNASYPDNAPKRQAYKAIIEALSRNGGRVFAKAFVMFQPTREHQEALSQVVQKDIMPYYAAIADEVPATNLHITLAYLSLPMNYPIDRNLLHRSWEIMNTALADLARRIKQLHFVPGSVVKPLGRFLAIEYTAPAIYTTLINNFYQKVLQQIRGSQKTYPEILPPHLSIAQAKPGITRANLQEAPERRIEGLAQISQFHGPDEEFKIGIRVPSIDSGTEEITF
jgi:ankyrin repeat protein